MTRDAAFHIPSLDGLRCVAIIPVFVSHALMAAGLRTFVPGNFGVTLFFFLSGYLITTLMRVELERTGAVDFKRFYARRALRIFPTCYLVLALAALFGLAAGTTDPWWLLGQMIHLTNYLIIVGGWTAPIAPNTDVYWSLAVEEHFYLLFPPIFVVLAKAKSRGVAAGALGFACVLVLAWRCWLALVAGVADDRTYLGTDTRADSILLGCILGLWGNPVLDRTRFEERQWKRVLFPLAIVILLITFLVPMRSFRESIGYTVQGLCLFPVFITAIRYPDWILTRMLNWQTTRFVGALSYAIYLVHPSMIYISRVLFEGGSLVVFFAFSLLLTIASAATLYYGIERPLARWRRNLNPLAGTRPPESATSVHETHRQA